MLTFGGAICTIFCLMSLSAPFDFDVTGSESSVGRADVEYDNKFLNNLGLLFRMPFTLKLRCKSSTE